MLVLPVVVQFESSGVWDLVASVTVCKTISPSVPAGATTFLCAVAKRRGVVFPHGAWKSLLVLLIFVQNPIFVAERVVDWGLAIVVIVCVLKHA